MDIYAQNILDRYKNPFHKGEIQDADIQHQEANHSCGDAVKIFLKLKEKRISEYRFEGSGCAISMAAADMLGDLTEEMNENQVLEIKKEDIYQALGIEIGLRRSKCALLSLLCLQNGILEHQGKEKRGWESYHV